MSITTLSNLNLFHLPPSTDLKTNGIVRPDRTETPSPFSIKLLVLWTFLEIHSLMLLAQESGFLVRGLVGTS